MSGKGRSGGGTVRRRGRGAAGVVGGSRRPYSRFDLYELCVQSPPHAVALLRAIHGAEPKVVGEDFCGTAAVSREWIRAVEGGKAIAVDLDAEVLRRAGKRPGLRTILGDCLSATGVRRDKADVIFVGNFSIGEVHDRGRLIRYLRRSRARLNRGGVFVCDTYGGASAFLRGSTQRDVPLPDGRRVRYTWEQREADPLTGMVVNAIHFQVDRGGEVELRIRDAFVYSWRLWSAPELRDAMQEAGFVETAVYDNLPDAQDADGNALVRPIESPDELEGSFIVCVAGRRG